MHERVRFIELSARTLENSGMYTLEGKRLDLNAPLQDYPTPQFRRDSFYSLNGYWDFSLDEDKGNHSNYPDEIVVPFAVETPLSQVETRVKQGQILHYRRYFDLPEGFDKGRVLLHFEAVDQIADVYLNGVKIAHHEGGYLPFTADCLEIKPTKNELLVDVIDDVTSPLFPRGKQSPKPSGIWYTPTSGIWGSVWLECVPNDVIQSIRIDPNYDKTQVKIKVVFEGKVNNSNVEVTFAGKLIACNALDENNEVVLDLRGHFYPWSPETPSLYGLTVQVNQDVIHSYFAMRKFSIMEHKGHQVFALNNKPYFLRGVLDQGYWPDGGLTAPSDQALINDVQLLKDLGFNMVRKHIKFESMRWYYHCDRLGLIVIQDLLNAGRPYKKFLIWTAPFYKYHFDDTQKYALLGRKDEEGRRLFEETMPDYVSRLYNVPSIAIWTLFNEGWGQFDSVRLTAKLRELDSSRLIDSTSGWFDNGAGDFDSQHIYFRKVDMTGDNKRILSLSEYAAFSLMIPGHVMSKKKTSYKYFKTLEDLTARLVSCQEEEVLPQIEKGLSVSVLTQLSDVESEVNGLITYDRKVIKVDADALRKANAKLTFEERDDD